MALNQRIRIARRFLRSIRVDADLGEASAIEGFVCPKSSADVLLTLAQHVSENRQGAFTWTGPYGSGKSSLAVALGALLNGNADLQNQATEVFGKKLTNDMWKALPTGTKGWRVLPVVGRRDNPTRVIGESVKKAGLATRRPKGGWNEDSLIKVLSEAAAAKPTTHGGLIVFIDEMGKFLEAAAQDGSDIYIFQELAEAASRSNGRLIVIGILHQAFDEYAHRLSREMRDEWAKIQGRFVDLVVDTAGEEQIDLIARAIESDRKPKQTGRLALAVASIARRERLNGSQNLADMLEECWPLHPVVPCLLGPISRRRFGQNQRSIFGFLNSSEPHGFQDYVNHMSDEQFYAPDRLWNYLRANLEPSILASPDGHRWALAAEALERCESLGGDDIQVRLLKTIAVIDLFKERSGLIASYDLLRTCFPKVAAKKLKDTLTQLEKSSFTIFKKFMGAHAIFAGSDFDIDSTVRSALGEIDEIDLAHLKSLAGLQPIVAKRHYHHTGTMRWFSINIVPVSEVVSHAQTYKPTDGAIGEFLLAIPMSGENEKRAENLCRAASKANKNWDVVVGFVRQSNMLILLARELLALDNVSHSYPELSGDQVARLEVNARIAELQSLLETELQAALDTAKWFRNHKHSRVLNQDQLNHEASEIADLRFAKCPKLHNELLNRQKPSSNAIAAQNALLRCMVLSKGKYRLGIDGYPAEGGLFASILESTGLYIQDEGVWRFVVPNETQDSARLQPLWQATLEYIKGAEHRAIEIAELFDLWHAPPFGVKEGLMTTLIVAFILSHRENLALYREGIFRAQFDDVDIEYLAKNAHTIQVRWMDLSDVSRSLLSSMANLVRKLDQGNTLEHLEPIDVARGLVAIYDKLPNWTKRTMKLSANAIKVRDLFKRAQDPNKFLFDDIPETFCEKATLAENLGTVIKTVSDGLQELVKAYPSMLFRLREIMLNELHVPNISPQSITELRERAENIRQLTGDFRLEAFAGRLSQVDGTDQGFEGIASLAANKPPYDWVDPDLDRSAIEIADLAQRFVRAETFARVKGRPEKRQAMAVMIGVDGTPTPVLEEFNVADTDRIVINALIDRVSAALEEVDDKRHSIILAALAELSARYMQTSATKKKSNRRSAS